ncbi:transcriptional regulator [Shewanella corallii]|uniref:Transcriptional regulator n=1 Tax=Shewanella corallii TaxID=560080 RepID=A0ABT0N4W2_9GAMM|nr:ACT domain-containing protein [Shewanella corallii]MCL2912931.1 transcriptional regulator [Shewanella corallii]
MQACFISTVSGPFSPHLIADIAKITRQSGGHWLSSKIIRIDDQFSAMMKVEVSSGDPEPLQDQLESTFPQLRFTFEEAGPQKTEHRILSLTLHCADRSGLTHDINTLFDGLDIAITHQENNRVAVMGSNETVYQAKLQLEVPQAMTDDDIAGALDTLNINHRVSFSE